MADEEKKKGILDTPDTTSGFDAKDIESNKALAGIGYIGILFLVPLLAGKESKYAQFHANQGLILFIFQIACSVVMIIPVLGWIAGGLGFILAFICLILGLINGFTGKAKELPFIGKFRIIKY